jgi:hypothetical protein
VSNTAGGWLLIGALVLAALVGTSLASASGSAPDGPLVPEPGARQAVVIAQHGAVTATESGKPVVTLEYTAPTSATWGPTAGAPPTFAFGKPAQVLLVTPGGYLVRQALPLEEARVHGEYVSQQIGQPIAVTIPDPAGGPPRLVYFGTSRNDR